MRRAVLTVLLAGCPADDSAPHADGSTSSIPGDLPQDPHGIDSTGAPEECADVYHGNNNPGSATEIELGTDVSDIVLEDLAVCSSTPSDFFALQAECAGYLSFEIRTDHGSMPDLVLYDDGQPIEQLMGVWYGFFLKPLQRHVGAGTHVLEVRHSGGGPQAYALVAVLLPDSTCR